jgi:uncharacterized membrane protein YebE (DUF533 family)
MNDIELKPSFTNIANLMVNPFAGYVGPLYAPFENAVANRMLQAVALLATYGGAAYAIRRLNSLYEKNIKSNTDKKKIASYLAAQLPIVSPDPIRDINTEKKEYMLGTEKLAMLNKKAEREWLDLALPIAALSAGIAGGYMFYDKYNKQQATETLDDEILRLKDELDKVNYKKLQLLRGIKSPESIKREEAVSDADILTKSASPRFSRNSSNRIMDIASKLKSKAEAIFNVQQAQSREGKDLLGLAKAILGLAAVGSFAGAAFFAKKYMDERDENRVRLDAVESALRANAQLDSSAAPIVIPHIPRSVDQSLDSDFRPNVNASSNKVKKVIDNTLPVLPPINVDVTDPIMSKLAR